MKRIITTLIISLLLPVTGCDSGPVFLGGGGGEVKYETERTIYLPMEKVITLNPMISKDEDTYILSKLIYDGLFELDENLEPQKKLVDSYNYSDDKLMLGIDLKSGVKWHDGADFTAEDVKFSIDAYINLSYSNETIYSGYVSNIKSVSLVRADPYKLNISFKSTANVGAENLVFPILPAHQFRRAADIRRNIAEFIPIGTGPYRILSYNNSSKLVLDANLDYYGTIPKNELEFTIFPQKRDALNLINVRNISLIINDEMDRDTLISNLNVNTVNFVSNRAEFVAFNMHREIMKDKRIRRAIAHAIDSQEILESAYLKSGILSDTIYYPYYFGNTNQEVLYEYDLEKAENLIKEAGFRDIDGDGYLEDRYRNDVSISILVNEDDQSRVAASQIIKNALDKLFLDSYIIYCDWDEYVAKITSGEYDFYIGGYAFSERYDLRHILHSQHNNKTGYSNPELDELLDELQSEVSNTRKAEVFNDINEILKDEIPYYCILYKTYGAISSVSLDGEIKPLFNNYYRNCEKWVCKYEIPAAVAE